MYQMTLIDLEPEEIMVEFFIGDVKLQLYNPNDVLGEYLINNEPGIVAIFEPAKLSRSFNPLLHRSDFQVLYERTREWK